MQRFALPSKQVEFELNGVKMAFEAPYPKDFATLLKLLDKFDA